ncbi:MAG TPA: M20/M25/M40 family metallo-hydrolase [Gemmatimonadaceae bacterium]|jgi:acetylornithine deacetylase/succinyl-diaminopimelate desuccinylase-like protein
MPRLAALRACFFTLSLVPTLTLRAQQPTAAVDWDRLRDETVQVLSDYLRINTTNPPGNELQTALYLKRILDREGIPAQILDTGEMKPPGRANLYARLEGNGTRKAIALVHHMDVVPSDARYWSVDPFSGVVKDGYVWGRGALDMKGEGIIHLMSMIALKRSGVPLNRDIVFIANSDEELDGIGAMTFVNRHADLLKDVEYLITEGGDNKFENGKLAYYGVGIAEKRTFWQHVTVHGTPSHGSRPTKQNPVPRLVAALDRIARYETPLHVTPGVDKYFRDISRGYGGDQKQWLSNVRVALENPSARAWILNDVYWNAILRNTISLTGLKGSNKTNVIPAEASADIDIRLLPDADPKEFLATLQGVVADTAVHFDQELAPRQALESPIETEFFHAIERAAHDRDPNAFVTTPMLTGATDRPTYRALGIVTYGFDPFKVEVADAQRGVHGNNERVSVENVGFGVHYLYDVLRYAQGTHVTP